ncbi:MAG: hypothetical protein AAFV53_08310 [Myxococcota bacterium]
MALPKKGSRTVTVEGVDYAWVTVDTFAVGNFRGAVQILTQRADGAGPRLHGVLAGPDVFLRGNYVTGNTVRQWLKKVRARPDVDLEQTGDIYLPPPDRFREAFDKKWFVLRDRIAE